LQGSASLKSNSSQRRKIFFWRVQFSNSSATSFIFQKQTMGIWRQEGVPLKIGWRFFALKRESSLTFGALDEKFSARSK
jgi:hypothetical protein